MATETSADRRVDRDRQYEFARSSRDLLRLVGGLILLLLGLVLATIFSDALVGLRGRPDPGGHVLAAGAARLAFTLLTRRDVI